MKKILILIINLFSFFISKLFIRSKKKIVFGSWGGDYFNDNSKYLSLYLVSKYRNYEVYWIGKSKLSERIPQNIKFLKYNSLKSIFTILSTKYFFITNSFTDICKFNILGGAIVTQLWHGGGIKKILSDSIENKYNEGKYSKFDWLIYLIGKKTFYKCSFFIASSEIRKQSILSSFRYFGITDSKVICHGQPRVDYLVNNSKNEYIIKDIKNKYNLIYGIKVETKVITYLPTFRSSLEKALLRDSFLLDNFFEENVFADNYCLIIKRHYKESGFFIKSGFNKKEIIYDISNESQIDTQELLLISDMIITDYSGVYLDYLVLNRPIIHYVTDYIDYIDNERSLKYDFDDVSGGPVVFSKEQLIKELKNYIQNVDNYISVRNKVNIMMNSYEEGIASESIIKKVLGGR